MDPLGVDGNGEEAPWGTQRTQSPHAKTPPGGRKRQADVGKGRPRGRDPVDRLAVMTRKTLPQAHLAYQPPGENFLGQVSSQAWLGTRTDLSPRTLGPRQQRFKQCSGHLKNMTSQLSRRPIALRLEVIGILSTWPHVASGPSGAINLHIAQALLSLSRTSFSNSLPQSPRSQSCTVTAWLSD